MEHRVGTDARGEVWLKLGRADGSRPGERPLQRAENGLAPRVGPRVHLDPIARREENRAERCRRVHAPHVLVDGDTLAHLEWRGMVAEPDHHQSGHQTRAPTADSTAATSAAMDVASATASTRR